MTVFGSAESFLLFMLVYDLPFDKFVYLPLVLIFLFSVSYPEANLQSVN